MLLFCKFCLAVWGKQVIQGLTVEVLPKPIMNRKNPKILNQIKVSEGFFFFRLGLGNLSDICITLL